MKSVFTILITLLSFSSILAQDKLKLELKSDEKPDVYIDGKKYDYSIFDLLDQDKIATVNVLKGESAKKEFNTTNSVIVVTTKKKMEDTLSAKSDEGNNGLEPLVMIDFEKADRKALEKLDPKDIEKIEVVKGERAIKEYNAPNGVIIVITNNVLNKLGN